MGSNGSYENKYSHQQQGNDEYIASAEQSYYPLYLPFRVKILIISNFLFISLSLSIMLLKA